MTPARVLSGQPEHELLDLCRQPWPSRPPTILAPLAVTVPRPQGPRGLTVREAEILRRLVNGDSNRMIATHLSLS